MKVLKDRPVQEDCLDLDAIEIKSKVFEINGWARGGFSYNEETKRLDTLITDGFSDWNLPVSIMAMKIRDNIYGFGFGVVDEDGTRAYTWDIIKFTDDVEVDDFICIRKACGCNSDGTRRGTYLLRRYVNSNPRCAAR